MPRPAPEPIACYSCKAEPNKPHEKNCPVRQRLRELELALRVSPDPENFANLNLVFEELPDGPMVAKGGELGLDASKVCGGLTIKALSMDIPGLGFRPVLGFEFYTVTGRKVQPILYTTEKLGDFMSIKALIYQAANTAFRTAGEMEAKRGD